MTKTTWLAVVALAVAVTGCDGGSPKPGPTTPPATSLAVAATVRATVTDRSVDMVAVARTLRARFEAVGAPSSGATSGRAVTFALSRRLTPAELAGLGRAGVLAFRPVLEQSAPKSCPGAAAGGSLTAPVVLCSADGDVQYSLGPAELTGTDVKGATARHEPSQSAWVVELEFANAQRWAEVTGRLAGQQLAIVLDGEVRSAPQVHERIEGGQATMSGDLTEEEARLLVAIVRSGALPATVTLTQS